MHRTPTRRRRSSPQRRRAAQPVPRALPVRAARDRRGLRHRGRRAALRRARWRRSSALRERYAAAGYGHGHRAGLLLENRPAFFLHWFALNALGVSVVPINAELRAAELDYLVGHSEMCLAVGLPERASPTCAPRPRGRPAVPRAADGRTTPAPLPPRRWPAPQAARSRSTATANARCSTPRAPPAGPRAACCPTDYYLLRGRAGTPRIGGLCTLHDRRRSACSRRCR